MNDPETKYAKTLDGIRIAYQVVGGGPVDLVYILGFAGNLEVEFENPASARFLEELSSFARVIVYDARGTGLSDRVLETSNLDRRADDLLAVLDATGSERAVLLGYSESGSVAGFFAATHPERVLALVLYASAARWAWAPDYPFGRSKADQERIRLEDFEGWGSTELAESWIADEAPSHVGDPEWVRSVAKVMRHAGSPAAALTFQDVQYETDVRGILPSVQAPTLVLSRAPIDRERGADLAERIPGAKYVHLAGKDRMPYAGDIGALLGEVEQFVRSVRAEEASFDRVLATVLFTDIVGSTEKAAGLGDTAWKELLERHHATVRAMIGRYRGTEISTAGDGFLATFDGPARGVGCAQAITEAIRTLGLEVRAGLHTGEVETIDGKVGGIAVHIGARVGALAGPSEVLVSQTVKDLVAGSGLMFEDAGEHELKGVPHLWRLYRVVS